MTLHEAIVEVLKGKKIARAKDIAESINSLGLYHRKDGKPVPASQIHARIKNYPELFIRELGGLYELRENITEGSVDYQRLTSDLFNLFSKTKTAADGIVVIDLVLWIVYLKHLLALHKRFSKEKEGLPGEPPISILSALGAIDNNGIDGMGKRLLELSDLLMSKERISSRLGHFLTDQIMLIEDKVWHDAWAALKSYQFESNTLNAVLLQVEKLKNLYLKATIRTSPVASDYLANLISAVASNKKIHGQMLNAFTGLVPLAGNLSLGNDNILDFHTDLPQEAIFLELRNLFLGRPHNLIHSDFIEHASTNQASYDVVFGIIPVRSIVNLSDRPKFTTMFDEPKAAELIYVEAVCALLKESGIAFLVVPQSLLFGTSNAHYNLRSKLLGHDWLESVISLPEGTDMPNSGIRQSLLVINKDKAFPNRGKVHFISAIGQPGQSGKAASVSPYKVIELIENQPNDSFSRVVPIAEITERDKYNIAPDRFLYPIRRGLEDLKSGRKEICLLREVLTLLKGPIRPNDEMFPFVKISNLKNSDIDFELTTVELEDIEKSSQKGVYLNERLLLTAKVGENLKPTLFPGFGNSILVSPNIAAFKVDESKVRIEYLIQELNGDFFKNQFKSILTGAAQQTWRTEDFLNLSLQIPVIAEQDKIITEKLEVLRRLKQAEADKLAEKTGARDREYSILSSVRHSLAQQFSSIRNDVASLKYFLENVILKEETITWSSPISKKRSLEQLITRMNDSVLAAEDTFEKIKSLTELNRRKLKFEKTELISFIQKSVEGLNLPEADFELEVETLDLHGEYVSISTSIDESPVFKPVFVDIDRFLFDEFLRNLVENAMKHGKFESQKLFLTLIIDGDPQKDKNVSILCFDSGKGVGKEFSYDEFFEFGKKSGESSGSGIGGYILRQISTLHGGAIKPLEYLISNPNYSNFQLELTIPFNQGYD